MTRLLVFLSVLLTLALAPAATASSGLWTNLGGGVPSADPVINYCGVSEVQPFFPNTVFPVGTSNNAVQVCRVKSWTVTATEVDWAQIWMTWGPGAFSPLSMNLSGPWLGSYPASGTFFLSTVAPSLTFAQPLKAYPNGVQCFVGHPFNLNYPTIPPAMLGQTITFQPVLYHYDGTQYVPLEVGQATQVVVVL